MPDFCIGELPGAFDETIALARYRQRDLVATETGETTDDAPAVTFALARADQACVHQLANQPAHHAAVDVQPIGNLTGPGWTVIAEPLKKLESRCGNRLIKGGGSIDSDCPQFCRQRTQFGAERAQRILTFLPFGLASHYRSM